MDALWPFLEFVLKPDEHLLELVQRFGWLVYGILFAIVFCETGLVVTPFLPGDSLLFAAGMLASQEQGLNVLLTWLLLLVAAILGDAVNYAIGRYAGQWMLTRHPRVFKPQYMAKTHEYFERFGGTTIIVARFVPIVRTFAPFVAGLGAMTYPKFAFYNVVGAFAWVTLCLYAGYFLGQLPWIRDNFSIVIMVIIVLSILPGIFEFFRHRRRAARERIAAAPGGASESTQGNSNDPEAESMREVEHAK